MRAKHIICDFKGFFEEGKTLGGKMSPIMCMCNKKYHHKLLESAVDWHFCGTVPSYALNFFRFIVVYCYFINRFYKFGKGIAPRILKKSAKT